MPLSIEKEIPPASRGDRATGLVDWCYDTNGELGFQASSGAAQLPRRVHNLSRTAVHYHPVAETEDAAWCQAATTKYKTQDQIERDLESDPDNLVLLKIVDTPKSKDKESGRSIELPKSRPDLRLAVWTARGWNIEH